MRDLLPAAKAVVLHSGGLDSSTLLALAIRRHGVEHVRTLSISYGQRHSGEVQAARDVQSYFRMFTTAHKTIDLDPDIFKNKESPGGSALIPSDQVEMPHMTYEELETSFGPSPTYVPFRNATFLSLATAYALTIGASEIWFGAHAEDAHNFAYPRV